MHKGLFITFEGGEGSGKTTQINRLAHTLSQTGQKILTTREPGGTPEGEKIRNLLVQREGGNWTPTAEILLLFAARVMHVEKIIKPALEDNKIVICDRFTDSTIAYQGYGHSHNIDSIEKIGALSLGDFGPDRSPQPHPSTLRQWTTARRYRASQRHSPLYGPYPSRAL